jgi:ribose transport system permease protein
MSLSENRSPRKPSPVAALVRDPLAIATPDVASGDRTAPSGTSAAIDVVRRFGTVVALAGLVLYFALATSGQILTSGSIAAILNQVTVVGILSLGLTVCLVLGQFDLSIGWTASLGGVVATGLMSENGFPAWLAVILALAAGALVGLVNGLVVTYLRVNAFLATLAMGSVLSGVISWYTISPFTANLSERFLTFGLKEVLGVPLPALVLFVLAVVLWVFLQQTASGRRMYALGGNAEAARIAGVRVKRLQIAAFVICSTCASLAGVLLAAQLGSGQPNGATGLLLGAFAAAFLGASTWRDGEFHIGGTVVGMLIMGVLFSGLALTDAKYFLKDVITGSILVLAVGGASLLKRGS